MENLLTNKNVSERKNNIQKDIKQNVYKLLLPLIILLLIAIIIGGGLYIIKPKWLPFKFNTKSQSTSTNLTKNKEAKKSDYVAVFLSNNQVYFGKISNLESAFPSLKEVYYLKVQRSLVPADEEEADIRVEGKDKKTKAPQQKNEMSLIKMGNELHAPTDEIKLNRDHILYIENLKNNSKVVKAIEEFKSKDK